jgi:DNA processing protein
MIQFQNAVSLWNEFLSYETLWGWKKGSLKDVADLFRTRDGLPSCVLDTLRSESLFDVDELVREVERCLSRLSGFSICLNRAFQYPPRLREARHPPELFYYRGDLGLTESRCVSVVGARSATDDGLRRAAKLARGLAVAGFTVVSGLAKGIDTAAMTAALEAGGHSIGVIGTTITESYPKENRALQERIAGEHLLMSQVPFYWYSREPFRLKRRYFPERNATMSALSEATIIVEASERSGTLTQARACLGQGRRLFILNSCFENPRITWPARYEKEGAIRVRDFDDVFSVLEETQKVNAE